VKLVLAFVLFACGVRAEHIAEFFRLDLAGRLL